MCGVSPEVQSGEQDEAAHGRICGTISPKKARLVGSNRIAKIYKDIDVNKNGSLQWEEFLDFFRRKGLLLTYATPNNPRDRMAETLGKEYQRRTVMAKWQRGG